MENDTWNFKKRMACTLNLLSFLPDQEEYNQIVVIPTHFYLNLTQRRKTKMGIWTTFFFIQKTKIYSNTAIKHAHVTCKTYFNCANIYLYDNLATQY